MKKVITVIVALTVILSMAVFASCKNKNGGTDSTADPHGTGSATGTPAATPGFTFNTPPPFETGSDPSGNDSTAGNTDPATGSSDSTPTGSAGDPSGATPTPGDGKIELPEDFFDYPSESPTEKPSDGTATPGNTDTSKETPTEAPTETPAGTSGTAKPTATEEPTRDPGVIVLPEIPL